MVSAYAYIVWFGVVAIEALALYIAIERGQIKRFWHLYMYFGLSCLVSVLRFVILQRYGLRSREYAYFYYYTDTILTVSLALFVASLFGFVCNLKTWSGIPLRLLIPGLTGVALFSYAVVQPAETRALTRFVVEFGQNLFFAMLLLTTAGWLVVLAKKMRASAEVNLLWVFFIYLSFLAADYGIRNLYPVNYSYWMVLPQFAGLWLVAGSTMAVLTDDLRFG